MALTFYPDDLTKGSLEDRVEILADAAERYKAVILDIATKPPAPMDPKKRLAPRELVAAYNWEAITRVLREVRELLEVNRDDKERKANLLAKLAEIYEVLRAAKMPKLEAVRLALINEANQLRGSGAQVA